MQIKHRRWQLLTWLLMTLCNSSVHFEYLLFADDTNAFLSGNNITDLYSTMSIEFEKLAV